MHFYPHGNDNPAYKTIKTPTISATDTQTQPANPSGNAETKGDLARKDAPLVGLASALSPALELLSAALAAAASPLCPG